MDLDGPRTAASDSVNGSCTYNCGPVGRDPVVPHGGVPVAVSRIDRAYGDIYGAHDARFSNPADFARSSISPGEARARRRLAHTHPAISRHMRHDRERRRTGCVYTTSMCGARARLRLGSLPATGSVRCRRSLFLRITPCARQATRACGKRPKSRTARGFLPRACSRARGEAQFTPARTGWTGSWSSALHRAVRRRAPAGGRTSCSSGWEGVR